MGRRTERELKRLERIHRRRIREQAERIKACVERDACEKQDCIYYALPDAAAELAEWVLDLLDDEEDDPSVSPE